MSGVQQLGPWQIAIASGLVVFCAIVSIALRLRLEKQLAMASARTVVQLLLVGYILKYVFVVKNPLLIALVALVMIAFASHAAAGRTRLFYAGVMGHAFFTLVVSGLLTTYIVTAAIVQVHPWYRPQYLIPLLGMILGNSLTGISIALDQLLGDLTSRRGEIEMELAHGATAWEAAQTPLRECVRRGMIPTINSMLVVGIVSLPGMMTGQILAGSAPVDAVKYQIVVMFMLAAATTIGCILVALLAYRRLFNDRHQLVSALIKPGKK
jgi:putative ABC transport system permease protein